MQLKLDHLSYEGRWFEYGGGKLFIRPYPHSKSSLQIKDNAIILDGGASLELFGYCLQKWEEMNDEKGDPIKLNAEIKKKVFDFGVGSDDEEQCIRDFVILKQRVIVDDQEEDEKN